MLNIIILFTILIGLIIHRYLTAFWEQRKLPYPMGFLMFANLFAVLYLINFIWMFGIIIGIIISILTFFQITYSTLLWPFLLPWLVKINKQLSPRPITLKQPTIPKANILAYGLWSYIVLGLVILTILNFLISDYMSLSKTIIKLFNENYISLAVIITGTVIVSNFVRNYIMRKFISPQMS